MAVEQRSSMPTAYEPQSVEKRWYAEWLERGYFSANPDPERKPFTIVVPPPNVTGALHMGHALTFTLQDVVIRRARMRGFETLFLPGTDHAGIATQVVVERHLREQGIEDPRSLGREAFVERVWAWKEQYGNTIVDQLKALGTSCNWDRLRFTMDEGLSKAVRVAFVRMYEDGVIYRGERIINWCPTDHTALSDSELEHEEVDGELITFRYPLVDGDGHIDVATTRIETMLGDTGVAVHPGDDRYRALVGERVRHPFTGEDLPIVADESVDPEFGTGAVKITPAHDPTDFEIGERAGLPRQNILTADATISDEAVEEFRGLDRYEARRRVLEALRDRGLIVAEERPYRHSVAHCYRCNSEIEPWLSGKQWFVKVDRLTGPAKQAAEDGRITFFPPRWADNYTTWLDNLRDWNISRQLWWGHRIPVWYCDNGHELATVEDPGACRECGSTAIEQDPDVLDTWFSSQLWPFSTLGWPDETPDLHYFYPTTVLVTGYEILYLWVARMIMSGLYLVDPGGTRTGDSIPFEHVLIHGLVRDEKNRKMSKSLGNVIDPVEFIERYGADALRFALARIASPEHQNYPLGESAAEAARNFANKVWNAARLVLGSYDGGVATLPEEDDRTTVERWILSRHEACRAEVDDALEGYRFSDAAVAIQRFLWSELADWGLEMEKPRLYEENEEDRRTASSVLAWVLERTLRLLHPMMPFLTEDIWQRFGIGDSIVVESWPEPHPEHRDAPLDDGFSFLTGFVSEVRSNSPAVQMGVAYDREMPPGHRALLEEHATLIERLTGGAFEIREDGRLTARVSRREGEGVRTTGEDAAAFRLRREKQLDDVRGRREREEAKLANPAFTEKAPSDVVDRARAKRDDLARQEEQIRRELEELGRLGE